MWKYIRTHKGNIRFICIILNEFQRNVGIFVLTITHVCLKPTSELTGVKYVREEFYHDNDRKRGERFVGNLLHAYLSKCKYLNKSFNVSVGALTSVRFQNIIVTLGSTNKTYLKRKLWSSKKIYWNTWNTENQIYYPAFFLVTQSSPYVL